jgi:hypothetical protein
MRKQQSKECEQESAGVEAPRQQQPSGENSIVVKVDDGGGNEPECALYNHAGCEQEYAPRQYQRLERF